MIPVTELRAGTIFRDSQGIWEVIRYSHTKMGRGAATIRVKSKNLTTEAILEKTFTSGQKIEDLELAKKAAQYLYQDAASLVFMDPKTFGQFSLSKAVLGEKSSLLREGEVYDLSVVEDSVISVEIPRLLVLAVTETGPGIKGDSVSNVFKDAVMENGLKVKVPLFINQGDKVKIDSRTLEYVERVK